MRQTNRRKFLKQTGVGIAVSVASVDQASTAQGANERILVGMIGCGGRGVGEGSSMGSRTRLSLTSVILTAPVRSAPRRSLARSNALLRRKYREDHWAVPENV